MLNKTAFSLQTQRGRRRCIQQHSHAWGGAEERRSTGPFLAGTSISRLPSPDLVWEVEINEFSALGKPTWAGLGAAPGAGMWPWEGQSPQAGYCRRDLLWQRGLTWSSQPLLLPSTPPCVFLPFPIQNFHHYYHFLTLFAFTAPATLQCAQKGLSKHQGGDVSSLHHLFFPKCNVGVQDFTPHYSSAPQPAVPWLRISPSSCCKPSLPGGPLPWILQTPDARILASKKSGFGLHLEPGS